MAELSEACKDGFVVYISLQRATWSKGFGGMVQAYVADAGVDFHFLPNRRSRLVTVSYIKDYCK